MQTPIQRAALLIPLLGAAPTGRLTSAEVTAFIGQAPTATTALPDGGTVAVYMKSTEDYALTYRTDFAADGTCRDARVNFSLPRLTPQASQAAGPPKRPAEIDAFLPIIQRCQNGT